MTPRSGRPSLHSLGSPLLGALGSPRLGVLGSLLLSVSGSLLLGGLLTACGSDSNDLTPTQVVERRDFVQRVTVEGQLEAEISTQLSVSLQVPRRIRLAWLEDEGKRVESGQLVARFDALEMQRQLEDGQGDHRKASLEIERTRIESDIEVSRLGTELQIADLELEHARNFQKLDHTVYARRDILQDAIDGELAQARKEHSAEAAGTQQALAQTELDLLAIQQRQAQLEIDQSEEALAGLEIRAPHAGILQLSRDWRGEPPRVGAEMWRGQSIGKIPDLSTLQARVYVLEADAGGLAEGKAAEVVIEAHPQTTFRATIRSVEALAKPRFPGSPVQYFGVVLGFDPEDLEALDADIMKPGSRVRATLLLESLDDALVVPRQAVHQQDGGSQVYVRDGGGFTPRAVELGPTSLGWAVVTSGVTAGEVVALAEPALEQRQTKVGGGEPPQDAAAADTANSSTGGP